MSEFYRAIQKLEDQKKKDNGKSSNGKSISKENDTPSSAKKPDTSSLKEHSVSKEHDAPSPVKKTDAPIVVKHQEKLLVTPSPKSNKLAFFIISLAIVGILGLNAAIFMMLNKYMAGRNVLGQQMSNIETLLTGNEQKIDGLAVEIRKSKLDMDEVTRVLNDISGKLATMERQSNANSTEVNALNREKSRMTERLNKIERELSAMAEQLKAANAAVAEVK